MIEDGYFPRTDVLSFTGGGKEWINHEWLPQSIFYILFKYWGFISIVLFTALAGTLIFVLLLYHKKFSWLLSIFLFLITYSIRPFIVPRPQIFAYLFLLVLVLLISWFYEHKSRKIMFVLPLVLFLWTNVHASIILAIPILFLVLIFEFNPLRRYNPDQLSSQDLKPLLIGVFAGLGSMLLNPFGYKIFWQALQPVRFSAAFHILLETQSIFKFSPYSFLLISHLLVIFVVIWQLFRNGIARLRLYELGLLLFLLMPFVAVKYVPFSWVIVLPIFIKIIPDLRKSVIDKLVVLFAILFAIFIFWQNNNLFKNPYEEWPKELTSFIKGNNLVGNAYNPYSWSGYLAWENKKPVFVNPALADLGGDVFWDGLDFEKGERIEEIINKYDLSVIISQPWTILPYSISLNSNWSLVYWDNFGVIYLRKNSGNDEVIKKYGLEIKYFNDSVESVLKKYDPAEIPDLIKNYKKAIERQPDLLLGRFRLGLIYQTLGDCTKAIEQYEEIIKLDNKLGNAHFRLAECYQKIGDIKSALSERELADKYKDNERWWRGGR